MLLRLIAQMPYTLGAVVFENNDALCLHSLLQPSQLQQQQQQQGLSAESVLVSRLCLTVVALAQAFVSQAPTSYLYDAFVSSLLSAMFCVCVCLCVCVCVCVSALLTPPSPPEQARR